MTANAKPFVFSYDNTSSKYGFTIDGEFQSFKSGEDTSDATAYPQHILSSYTAYARGEKITGNIVTRSSSNITITGSQTYYSGYYPSNWTVTGLDTSDADATADNIETGKTAYVNGVKITGTAKIAVPLVYKDTTSLSKLHSKVAYMAATNIGNYALFAGGESYRAGTTTYYLGCTAYTTSLSRSNPALLSVGRSKLAATSVGNYALFGGGQINGYSDAVDTYNTSLSRSTTTALDKARCALAATSVGNYALFGGGGYAGSVHDKTDVYNASLTKSTSLGIYSGKCELAAASIGNYALFSGGLTSLGSINSISMGAAYNTSLSVSSISFYSAGYLAATSIENYALFGGGYGSPQKDTVYAVNSSLTISQAPQLSTARYQLSAANISRYYALFAGGSSLYASYGSPFVDVYDNYLTHSAAVGLTNYVIMLTGVSIGDYALFGGGRNNSNGSSYPDFYDTVDAYSMA